MLLYLFFLIKITFVGLVGLEIDAFTVWHNTASRPVGQIFPSTRSLSNPLKLFCALFLFLSLSLSVSSLENEKKLPQNFWENIEKILGKYWENIEKIKKIGENMGKYWFGWHKCDKYEYFLIENIECFLFFTQWIFSFSNPAPLLFFCSIYLFFGVVEIVIFLSPIFF